VIFITPYFNYFLALNQDNAVKKWNADFQSVGTPDF